MEKRHRKIKRRRLIQILSIILVFLIVICIVMLLWGKKENETADAGNCFKSIL